MNTIENIIWLGILVYALVEAGYAAVRVYHKRRSLHRSIGRTSTPALLPPVPAEQSSTQAPQSSTGLNSSMTVAPAVPTIADMTPDPETSMPLAASVSVNELVHPQPSEITPPDFVPDDLAAEMGLPDIQTPPASDQPSVLEEIQQLGQAPTEDAISHFMSYLDHPDHVIRSAAVFELGELASKQQSPQTSEIIDRLTELGQDVDPQVRSQAIVALEKMRSSIGNLQASDSYRNQVS